MSYEPRPYTALHLWGDVLLLALRLMMTAALPPWAR